MRYIILILLIPMTLSIYAQGDCSPTLKEIYDFEIGNVFEYEKVFINHNDLGAPIEREYIRSTVIDKNINADTIQYVTENKTFSYDQPVTQEPGGLYSNVKKSNYMDTILFVDSTNHFLNACDSQLVIPKPHFSCLVRALANSHEAENTKRFGFAGLEHINDTNDSLVEIDYCDYLMYFEQTYAKGLGLISEHRDAFEQNWSFELNAYIKEGDTVGFFRSNPDFPVNIFNLSNDNINNIYPTVLSENNIINININRRYSDLKIFSVDGKSQAYQIMDENRIEILNISTGIYFVVLFFDDLSISHIIIKQ